MTEKTLFTIGVYGTTEESFFRALREAGIDTFCDVRQRRGMRGSRFAYVNSTALQTRLAEERVAYLHLKALAPPDAVRSLQRESDQLAGLAKSERELLTPAFVEAYRRCCLSAHTADILEALVGPGATRIALFCVERSPAACHRSLIAEEIACQRGWPVHHLLP